MSAMELLPEKISELVHELSVLPFDNMHYEEPVTSPWVLTNYTVWMIFAFVIVVALFVFAANAEKKRMAVAEASGNVTDLAPRSRVVSIMEAGVEFIRNMAIDVIGPKDGPKYTALLATFFFMILVSNMLGLIPGGKSVGGAMGGTVALALITWIMFVGVGIKKNGGFGYLKSLIPSGVRQMKGIGGLVLGAYLFILEFLSTFLIRPLTLSVRLFANLYAGHIILGVFAAFVSLFWPFVERDLSFTIGGMGIGLVSLLFLVIMYAFELFVAFIQAYVFTILTAVYIQSSVHASEH